MSERSDDSISAGDPDEQARRIAAESLTGEDPTSWFDRVYAAAERGEVVVPWDRKAPHMLLREWAERNKPQGSGRGALVVGSGLGDDAEYIAGFGFQTVAFDVSPTAIRVAKERFPGSKVRYLTADLLDPPKEWSAAFDLVFESLTVQSLPVTARPLVISNVARMVAPGGTLLVIAAVREEDEPLGDMPPWPLTRSEVGSFGTGDLRPVRIEEIPDATEPSVRRWRAEFQASQGSTELLSDRVVQRP